MKRAAYKKWFKSKSLEDKEEYRVAKKAARKVVAVAKESGRKQAVLDMKLEEKPAQIFKVARQMARGRREVEGVNCLRNAEGFLVVQEH